MRVDDRGVAKKARYIVVCARSLVFLFSFDEALAHVVHFRRRLLLAHYVSVTWRAGRDKAGRFLTSLRELLVVGTGIDPVTSRFSGARSTN